MTLFWIIKKKLATMTLAMLLKQIIKYLFRLDMIESQKQFLNIE